MKFLRLLFIILSFSGLNTTVFAQHTDPEINTQNAVNFLKTFVIEHNKNAERGRGISVEFTGGFIELPTELKSDLSVNFPNNQFIIAKMTKFNTSPYPETLLLVADTKSGNIISYAWDLAFDGVSDSFRNTLNFYNAKSENDALGKVKVLSNLLTFLGEGKIGKATIKRNHFFFCWIEKDVISSELFYPYQPDGKPFRVLQVSLNNKLKFGEIKLINPFAGKEGSKASLSTFNKFQ